MKRLNSKGQTLIALLIFMLVAITITLAAAAVSIINLQSTDSFAEGEQALQDAQSGIEDTIIQLERNPSYSGSTMTLPSGTATITVSGSGSLTIISVGTVGNYRRTITANVTNTANVFTINSWSETP